MAEQLLREHGDIVDSSTSNAIVRLRHQGVGILRNKGLQTVYIVWNASSVNATETRDADVSKTWIEANEEIDVPQYARFFTHRTASGTSKLLYLENSR